MSISSTQKYKLPYNQNRPNLAVEVKRKAKLEKRKRILKYFVGILALIAILYCAFNSIWGDWFVVNEVKVVVKDESKISTQTVAKIKNEAQVYLKDRLFFVIPQDKTFTYPIERAKQEIVKKYIDVQSVEIESSGSHNILIEVNPREPVAYICNNLNNYDVHIADDANDVNDTDVVGVAGDAVDALVAKQIDDCNYLDENGLVFTSVSSLANRKPSNLFEIEFSASTTAYKIGNNLLIGKDIKELLEIVAILKKFDMNVSLVKALAFEGYDLIASQMIKQIDKKSSKPVTISVSKGDSLQTSKDNLFTFLNNHKRDPEKNKLIYLNINARYNPTVYYTTQ